MSEINSQPLSMLVDRQLSAVTFVQDYIQLWFDGPCLTAITDPRILTGEIEYGKNTYGYRDALCERIGQVVSESVVIEGKEIRIKFCDGVSLAISLHPEDYYTAEAAIFANGSGETWVW